jgi:co-chaperonin GroES (HSP10)
MKVKLEYYNPIGNTVLCKLSAPEKTEGGVHIPEEARKFERAAKVVKIGHIVEPELVDVGDIVIIGDPKQGIELEFAKEKYLQVPIHSLLGVVKE